MSRHRKFLSNYQQQQGNFMQDLQESLLKSHDLYGINAFEDVFSKKKQIIQLIQRQKKVKQQAHQSFIRAKQRIAQIQQLQGKVDKQASLLKNQVNKITDAHNMSKLLMMQKILRLQRQTEQLQRKREKCYKIKAEHHQSTLANISRRNIKIQKSRLSAMSQTLAIRQQKDEKNYETIQTNRRKAQSVRLDKQRRKSRLKRIQQYKYERAHKNYMDKVSTLQQTLQFDETQLSKLLVKQQQQQRHLKIAQNVTDQYLNSFFATSTIV